MRGGSPALQTACQRDFPSLFVPFCGYFLNIANGSVENFSIIPECLPQPFEHFFEAGHHLGIADHHDILVVVSRRTPNPVVALNESCRGRVDATRPMRIDSEAQTGHTEQVEVQIAPATSKGVPSGNSEG